MISGRYFKLRGFEKGKCPLCLEEEGVKHMLLDCKETKKGGRHIFT
jgi:hypothetical protein